MKTNKRAIRRAQRERLVRRAEKNHDGKLYFLIDSEFDRFTFWTERIGLSPKEARKRIERDRKRDELRVRMSVSCPSKFAYRDDCYTGERYTTQSRDARRDVREQMGDMHAANVRLNLILQGDVLR